VGRGRRLISAYNDEWGDVEECVHDHVDELMPA
jgi:hypothetical protein